MAQRIVWWCATDRKHTKIQALCDNSDGKVIFEDKDTDVLSESYRPKEALSVLLVAHGGGIEDQYLSFDHKTSGNDIEVSIVVEKLHARSPRRDSNIINNANIVN
jgi:hypothetical protein